MIDTKPAALELPAFDRHFWDGTFRFTRLGKGALGGKAGSLVFMKDLLADASILQAYPGVEVNVPTLAVIGTDSFDEFIDHNHLRHLPLEELADDRIGHAFQQAELPIELLGDL